MDIEEKDVNDLVHCDVDSLAEALPLFEHWGV